MVQSCPIVVQRGPTWSSRGPNLGRPLDHEGATFDLQPKKTQTIGKYLESKQFINLQDKITHLLGSCLDQAYIKGAGQIHHKIFIHDAFYSDHRIIIFCLFSNHICLNDKNGD